jgi:hypothetical protein
MIEAVNFSETSVNICQATRRNIPEDSHLHTRRLENLKSHLYQNCFHCKQCSNLRKIFEQNIILPGA